MSGLFNTDNSQNYLVENADNYDYDNNSGFIVRNDYYTDISQSINDLLLLTDISLSNLSSQIFDNLLIADLSFQEDINGYLHELSNNTFDFKNL